MSFPNMSTSESTMLNLQYQMKQNNQDLQNFLTDLDSWEQDIKQVDSKLAKKETAEETKLPPVRNSLEKKKKKKVKKKSDIKSDKPKRIKGYDYRSWDKFDVDKACENIDDENRSSSEYEYETDEEWENERKKQAAVMEKDTGNEYFKKGDFDRAIECYTKGYTLDPTNPLLPANRAMALLKQDKFAAAELDCSVALALDPLYTKAYLRRGTARMGLAKYEEAKRDYERVLQLEPQNKKAKSDMILIEKELAKKTMVTHSDTDVHVEKDAGIVRPVYKTHHERSKKPLRRIHIEEVGIEDDVSRKSAIASTVAQQSNTKKDIIEKEQQMFEKFTAHSPGDIGSNTSTGATLSGKTSNSIPETSGCEGAASTDNACDKTRLKIETLNINSEGDGAKSNNDNVKVENDKPNIGTGKKGKVTSQKADRKESPVTSTTTSPRELAVPNSSIQFQADFKMLKDNKERFYQYFRKIPLSEYTKLFGQFMDADVLLKILFVIKEYYFIHGDDCLSTLKMLTQVKRFSMVVMFFSKKEKTVLQDIFTQLKSSGKHTDEVIRQLEKAYSLS